MSATRTRPAQVPGLHEQERSFGISVGLVCGLISVYSLWRGRLIWAWLFGAGALGLIVPALARPSLLRIPHALWARLAHALGWLNTRVLLSAIFLVMITPIGVLLRLWGWDPLRRRATRGTSGWLPYPQRLQEPTHYRRMY